MAAALLSRLASRAKRIRDLVVDSAGISARDGDEAKRDAIKTMENRGIDLRDHSSKSLTASIVQEADLILTMTREHMELVLEQFTESQSKVRTLGSYVGTDPPCQHA